MEPADIRRLKSSEILEEIRQLIKKTPTRANEWYRIDQLLSVMSERCRLAELAAEVTS